MEVSCILQRCFTDRSSASSLVAEIVHTCIIIILTPAHRESTAEINKVGKNERENFCFSPLFHHPHTFHSMMMTEEKMRMMAGKKKRKCCENVFIQRKISSMTTAAAQLHSAERRHTIVARDCSYSKKKCIHIFPMKSSSNRCEHVQHLCDVIIVLWLVFSICIFFALTTRNKRRIHCVGRVNWRRRRNTCANTQSFDFTRAARNGRTMCGCRGSTWINRGNEALTLISAREVEYK